MAFNPQGRATVDPTRPRAFGTCQRCGWIDNLYKFRWQYEWAGTKLQNLRFLVCDVCYDKPQEQLRTIVLPPDPPPILNALPEPYAIDETNYRVTMDRIQRITQNGDKRIIFDTLGTQADILTSQDGDTLAATASDYPLSTTGTT